MPSDYLPVYFQACKLATPTASGLDLLGLTLSLAPISILVGFTVAKYQCYRPQLWVGWSLMMVSMGLLSTLTASTPLWRAIGYSILTGSAMGTTLTATLYPILAPLPVSANAPAIALSIFLRVFGQVRRLPSCFFQRLILPCSFGESPSVVLSYRMVSKPISLKISCSTRQIREI